MLGCLYCLLKDHVKHSEQICDIPSLVTDADQHYTMMQNIRSIEEPPQELKELLSKQDESLTNLSLHITKEKNNVEQMINEIQKSFISLTNNIKDTFNKDLDAQIDILLANYTTYKRFYSGFYRSERVKSSEFPSFADIMNRLNKATDKKELENQLKMLHRDILLGNSLSGTIEEKIKQMKNMMIEFSKNLKSQISSRPSADKLVISIKQEMERSIAEIANNFEKNKRNPCENPILLFNGAYPHFSDSVIIKPDVVTLFTAWLSSKTFNLKLLYRGSKDGYTAEAFHQKCDNTQHTITVVENNNSKILGGYSDQSWDGAGWKPSSKSFLFSITDREIYPLNMAPHPNAVYANNCYGPTFGGNHDFYIVGNCNINNGSYVCLGNAYDAKGKSREQIGGSYTFIVKEIEVFAVNFL
jgi:hypothetical protein